MWTDLFSVLSQSTRLTDGETDRHTDEQTSFSSLVRAGIQCSAEKP